MLCNFCLQMENNPTEIHKDAVATYGGNTMSKKQVYHWCTLFKGSRTSLDDEPRTGRPLSSTCVKKCKVQQSARHLMATVFWGDAKGFLLVDFLTRGQSVNADKL